MDEAEQLAEDIRQAVRELNSVLVAAHQRGVQTNLSIQVHELHGTMGKFVNIKATAVRVDFIGKTL